MSPLVCSDTKAIAAAATSAASSVVSVRGCSPCARAWYPLGVSRPTRSHPLGQISQVRLVLPSVVLLPRRSVGRMVGVEEQSFRGE